MILVHEVDYDNNSYIMRVPMIIHMYYDNIHMIGVNPKVLSTKEYENKTFFRTYFYTQNTYINNLINL